jgi:hypothetical protein
MIGNDFVYLMDDDDDDNDDYDEDLPMWNYNDWLASSIETSADFEQLFDNDLVRLTSLSPPNATKSFDSILSSSSSSPTDSSSSTFVYSLIDLTENCISPALSQLIAQLLWILLVCCLFRLISLWKLCSSRQLHYLQISSSLAILHYYFHFQTIYLLTYIIMGYLAFQVCLDKCRPYLTYIMVCFSVIYVLACEFLLIEREKWHSTYVIVFAFD